MGQIRVLPDHLANQIAAGEVVERPVSALKELLENAIDAGAKTIRVDLEAGGKRRIRVNDDGHGMDRDDCLMALERHATSKLTRAEDLFSIKTLGFRGEALPSIASVSRMTISSRHQNNDTGVQVELAGTKMLKVEEVSRPVGTTITVEQLFFNIPARKKFLRKTETELSLMVNLVTQYSMRHVNIHFVLMHNGRSLIDVTPVAELSERIYQHYGKEMLDQLVPFEKETQWLKISGLTSSPTLYRSSRNFQYLFVNNRLVKDKVLNHAISEAYRGFSEDRIFPVIFLFLEMPSQEVDVNVHPAKTEVKFINSHFVHDQVTEAVREALVSLKLTTAYRFREGYHAHPTEAQPAKRLDPWAQAREQQQQLPGGPAAGPLFDPNASHSEHRPSVTQATEEGSKASGAYQSFYERHRNEIDPQQGVPDRGLFEEQAAAQPAQPHAPGDGQPPPWQPRAAPTSIPRILGQFRDSYILAEQEGDLLLIDQHVAHERILYDQIKAGLEHHDIETQALLVPIMVELTPDQAVDLENLMPTLKKFGFDLEPYGHHTYAIREMPTFVKQADLERQVTELLAKASGERQQETMVEEILDHFAATKSCKAAIKINMRLTPEKMEYLVAELWSSSSPLFCPHGRPIILRFSNDEIEKNFFRK